MLGRRILIAAFILLAVTNAHAQNAAEINAEGIAHYQGKDYNSAITSFSKAFNIAPDNATIRANLCNAYRAGAQELAEFSDLGGAARMLEKAININPKNADAFIHLGWCYLQLDQVSDAIFRLEEATELAPDNVTALELLGDAYYKDNDLPSAVSLWQWVIDLAPGDERVLGKLEKANREFSVEEKFRRHSSRNFEMSYPPDTSGRDMSRVLTILEGAYRSVGLKFKRTFPPGPIQVIIYSAEDFLNATQLGEHIGGVYDGKIRVPIKDKSGALLKDDELKRRLVHEYVHVVVRHIAGDKAPWWLNEGLAQMISEDFSPRDKRMLRDAFDAQKLFSLEEISGTQLDGLEPHQIALAYCQAHFTVQHMRDRFGQNRLVDFLIDLGGGGELQDELWRYYRRTFKTMQTELNQKIAAN